MWSKQQLFHQPTVILYHGVLSDQQCDSIIDRTREKLQPSLGYDFATRKSQPTQHRTNSSYYDGSQEFAFALAAAYQAISPDFGSSPFDLTHFESAQVQHYSIGQQYKHHCDFFNYPQLHCDHNDRTATCIIYLNTVQQGGETDFPLIGLTVKPQKGCMLFFDYRYQYSINEKTKHAGLPPTAGEKWILTAWIREKPAASI